MSSKQKKSYRTPKVKAYGNIRDITLASADRTLKNKDANASRPAKTS